MPRTQGHGGNDAWSFVAWIAVGLAIQASLAWSGQASAAQEESAATAPLSTSSPAFSPNRIPLLGADDLRFVITREAEIGRLRGNGEYAEALMKAQEIVDRRQALQGADWWEAKDAVRLRDVLRQISGLPPAAQAELARVEAAAITNFGAAAAVARKRTATDEEPANGPGILRHDLRLAETQYSVRNRLLGEQNPETLESKTLVDVLSWANSSLLAFAFLPGGIDVRDPRELAAKYGDPIKGIMGLAGRLSGMKVSDSLSAGGFMDFDDMPAALRESMQPIFDRLRARGVENPEKVMRVAWQLRLLGLRADEASYEKMPGLLGQVVADLRTLPPGALKLCVDISFSDVVAKTSEDPALLEMAGPFASGAGAVGLLARLLERDLAVVGKDHPRVAILLAGLADQLATRKEWDRARAFLRESARIRRQLLGDFHPLTAATLLELAALLAGSDRTAEAVEILVACQSIYEAIASGRTGLYTAPDVGRVAGIAIMDEFLSRSSQSAPASPLAAWTVSGPDVYAELAGLTRETATSGGTENWWDAAQAGDKQAMISYLKSSQEKSLAAARQTLCPDCPPGTGRKYLEQKAARSPALQQALNAYQNQSVGAGFGLEDILDMQGLQLKHRDELCEKERPLREKARSALPQALELTKRGLRQSTSGALADAENSLRSALSIMREFVGAETIEAPQAELELCTDHLAWLLYVRGAHAAAEALLMSDVEPEYRAIQAQLPLSVRLAAFSKRRAFLFGHLRRAAGDAAQSQAIFETLRGRSQQSWGGDGAEDSPEDDSGAQPPSADNFDIDPGKLAERTEAAMRAFEKIGGNLTPQQRQKMQEETRKNMEKVRQGLQDYNKKFQEAQKQLPPAMRAPTQQSKAAEEAISKAEDLRKRGSDSQARRSFAAACALLAREESPRPQDVERGYWGYVTLLLELGDVAAARAMLTEWLGVLQRCTPAGEPARARTLALRAVCEAQGGELAAARATAEDAVRAAREAAEFVMREIDAQGAFTKPGNRMGDAYAYLGRMTGIASGNDPVARLAALDRALGSMLDQIADAALADSVRQLMLDQEATLRKIGERHDRQRQRMEQLGSQATQNLTQANLEAYQVFGALGDCDGDLAAVLAPQKHLLSTLMVMGTGIGEQSVAALADARQATLARALFNRGQTADFVEAERLVVEALIRARTEDLPERGRLAAMLAELTRRRNGSTEAIRALLIEAVDCAEEARILRPGDEFSHARSSRLAVGRDDPVRALLRLLCAGGDAPSRAAAFEVWERGRGRALRELLGRRKQDPLVLLAERAARTNDTALVAKLQAIKSTLEKSSGALAVAQNGVRQGGATSLARAMWEAADAQRSAYLELYDLAQPDMERSGAESLDARRIQARLDPGDVLLGYDVGDDSSWLLVVTHDDLQAHPLTWIDRSAVTSGSLRPTVAAFFRSCAREAAPGGPAQAARTPRELGAAILPESVRMALRDARRVLIAPDGPLHYLPFEALPLAAASDGADRVWLDEFPPIVYGSSATLLLAKPERGEREPREAAVLLISDPLIADSAAVAPEESAGPLGYFLRILGPLSPLPGTQVEVRALEQIAARRGLRQVTSLQGKAATYPGLFRAAAGQRYVHFATHGFAAEDAWALESGLLLSPSDSPEKPTRLLRLADLLEEWSGKLDGTELVTLSACRTARGEIMGGEGVVALPWGFLYAGAERVVGTLWTISDATSVVLMRRFYENLLGDTSREVVVGKNRYAAGAPLPTADALFEAKRYVRSLDEGELRRLAANLAGAGVRGGEVLPSKAPPGESPKVAPYHWAGFVVYGRP